MSERENIELENALASTRMEGYAVTEQTKEDCIRLLSGSLDVAAVVREILARPAQTA